MENGSKTSVSFTCGSTSEADLIRSAVNQYVRVVLRPLGIDPHNYAPASEEGAGFGWDAVQRAPGDMGNGTVTHMSRRMAEAIRAALWDMAEGATDGNERIEALSVTGRLSILIGGE